MAQHHTTTLRENPDYTNAALSFGYTQEVGEPREMREGRSALPGKGVYSGGQRTEMVDMKGSVVRGKESVMRQ